MYMTSMGRVLLNALVMERFGMLKSMALSVVFCMMCLHGDIIVRAKSIASRFAALLDVLTLKHYIL